MSFDYYYGDESNQFAFYRIPRQLITGEDFKKLSTDAKLLYGLLLDRMGLSAKNGWYDEAGRVYIYYTLDEIQEDLNCGHEKAVRLLAELDTGEKGFGLIERVKQGQGRPTKIYVKRFTTRAKPPQPVVPQEVPRLSNFWRQEVGKKESQVFGFAVVKPTENGTQVILNLIRLNTVSLIHLSIHRFPGRPSKAD